MSRYEYTLTSSTPLSAGESDQRSNIRRVHQVIPGATLRGALAAHWWKSHNERDAGDQAAFQRLFDSELIVGQAVPGDYELVSASARVCKYRNEPGCESVLLELGIPGYTPQWTTCWICGGPLSDKPGWRSSPDGARVTSVVERTRTELTLEETAKEGNLFTRQALAANDGRLVLRGFLELPDSAVAHFDNARVRVGGGRSLDFGNSTLKLEPVEWPGLPERDQHLLRLVSPTIVLDRFGGPQLSLSVLQAEIRRVSEDKVKLHANASWLRSVSISGWHMRSRLPKALDWAFAPGSVVVAQGLSDQGWRRLSQGVGYRTLEGFGQLELISKPAANEPRNEGVELLGTLRQKIAKQRDWASVKQALLATLEKMLDADAQTRVAHRETIRLPNTLLAEPRVYVNKILSIPVGHVQGTIDKLRSMR